MADLETLLADEATAVAQFVALLGTEQQALQDGDLAVLPGLSEQKAAVVEQLGRLGRARNQQLQAAGLAADQAGLKTWAANLAPRQALVARILSLAAEAREINRLNGLLIASRLQQTQSALDILTRSQSGGGLYGPDGQTANRFGYRFFDSA